MAKQELTKLTAAARRQASTDAEPAAVDQTAEVAAAPAEQPAVAATTQQPEPQQPSKATTPRRSEPVRNASPGETATKGVAFNLPVSLDEKLAAYMQKTGKSHHRILLEAIARTYPQLPELIRKGMSGDDEDAPQEDEIAALFDMPAWSAPKTSQEARVKHIVRVSSSNRQKLDDITRELGAPSRNFVIITAYKAFLSTNES